MSSPESWRHKWFGVWKEMNRASDTWPSISDFIDEKRSQYPDMELIVKYLETARAVTSTSRVGFPCVLTGKRFSGSLSYRTDGTWLWPDDLAYYVREHHVCLPDEMVAAIRHHNFQPPNVTNEMISNLEWP